MLGVGYAGLVVLCSVAFYAWRVTCRAHPMLSLLAPYIVGGALLVLANHIRDKSIVLRTAAVTSTILFLVVFPGFVFPDWLAGMSPAVYLPIMAVHVWIVVKAAKPFVFPRRGR